MALILKYSKDITIEEAKNKFKEYNLSTKKYSPSDDIEDFKIRFYFKDNLIYGDITLTKVTQIMNIGNKDKLLDENSKGQEFEDDFFIYEKKVTITEKGYFGLFLGQNKILFLNSKKNSQHFSKLISYILFGNDNCIKNINFKPKLMIEAQERGDTINGIWSLSVKKPNGEEYVYRVSNNNTLIEKAKEQINNIDGLGIIISTNHKPLKFAIFSHGSLNLPPQFLKKIKDKRIQGDNKIFLEVNKDALIEHYNFLRNIFLKLGKFTDVDVEVEEIEDNSINIEPSVLDFF